MTKEEQLFKAKIPGPETGIEIRRTMCDICAPGAHCGVNAYVKDGRLLKVEGTPGYPGSNGKLCTKGAANRQYIYRKDRILSPMVRTGPKGSDEFRQATWEEALTLIADNLKKMVPALAETALPQLRGPQLYDGIQHLLQIRLDGQQPDFRQQRPA